MIVDCVQLYLKAGNGGEGACCQERISSRRIIGSGGDGGRGGSIFFKADTHHYDLSKFRMNKKFTAPAGGRGREHNKKGRDADDLRLALPQWTIIRDLSGRVIADLDDCQKEILICQGGAAGVGNYRKGYTVPAGAGEVKEVILDYRIFNDIAIVGFPNSGKTALFNALTAKAYKVAPYPFTTNSCVWAHMAGKEECRPVILDTPPLNKQSAKKEGQENFLKHLYRSKIILCLSDNIVVWSEEFNEIKERLNNFGSGIIKDKKIFYLLTKIDKIDKTDEIDKIIADGIITVSAEEGIGLDNLKAKIGDYL